jgi:hypothetical protein
MLFVILPEEPGYFFGQLEKMPVKDLNDMFAELTMAYSTYPNPPLLYADVISHLWHYAVIHWDEDNKFYRIFSQVPSRSWKNKTIMLHTDSSFKREKPLKGRRE